MKSAMLVIDKKTKQILVLYHNNKLKLVPGDAEGETFLGKNYPNYILLGLLPDPTKLIKIALED